MTTVRFGHVPNPFAAPVTAAIDEGYFLDAGIEIELTTFANGSGSATALTAGEVDVVVGGHVQTLGAGGQVFIAPLGFERAPDHLPIAIVSTRSDLEGASIAVSARAAISDLQLRIFLGDAYDTVTLVPMPFDRMAGALERGEIAAASAPDPFAAELAEAGLGRVVDRGSLSRALPDGERVLITGIATTRAWVDANAAAAAAVIDAIGRAIDDLRAAPASGGRHQPYFDRRLEPAHLQRVYDLAFEHGLVDSRADAVELILE